MISQRQAEVDSGNDPGGNGKAGPSSGAVTPGGFSNGEGSKEFLSTARTGRRNALPHILNQNQQQQQQQDPGTADLPSRFEALTTDEQHSTYFLQFISNDKIAILFQFNFVILQIT